MKYFESSNLNFIATALLCSRSVVIKKVIKHPTRELHKVYSLTPFEIVNKLYREYVSDQLKVSPQQLVFKITQIRIMPPQEENK